MRKKILGIAGWLLILAAYMLARKGIIQAFPPYAAPHVFSWTKWVIQDVVLTSLRLSMLFFMLVLWGFLHQPWKKISFSMYIPREMWLYVLGVAASIAVVSPIWPNPDEIPWWLVGLITSPIVALNEEIAFRWIGLDLFDFLPAFYSAMLVSLLFVFFHLGWVYGDLSFSEMAQIFLFGMFFSFLRMRTGSLFWPVIFHSVVDILEYFSSQGSWQCLPFLVLLCVVSFIALLQSHYPLFRKRYEMKS